MARGSLGFRVKVAGVPKLMLVLAPTIEDAIAVAKRRASKGTGRTAVVTSARELGKAVRS